MRINFIISLVICFCHFGLNASTGSVDECSNTNFEIIEPEYAETEEERVSRIEEELMAALNQFDGCLEEINQSKSISSSSQSSQSSSAVGDEPTKIEEKSTESVTNERNYENNVKSTEDFAISENGSIPKDIPEGTNDDTVARQMRATAMAEKDPEKKKLYWDLYREYKGIKKPD
jgi:hypothetical protein